VTSCN